MIENLPVLTPDAARRAHTMARCHDRLAAGRRRLESRKRAPNSNVPAVDRLLAAGLCVAYLVSMANNILRVVAP